MSLCIFAASFPQTLFLPNQYQLLYNVQEYIYTGGNYMQSKLLKLIFTFTLILTLFTPFVDQSTKAATTETAFINTTSTLNVRSGTSDKSKIIGTLNSGYSVTVYSKTKTGWSEIRYNGKKAYVSTRYLKFYKGVTVSQRTYKGMSILKYPQVSGLKSKTAENKINTVLFSHIKKSYAAYLNNKETEKDEDESTPPYEYKTTYSIKYNDGNKLSILFNDYIYFGGAHGSTPITAYNFNVSTGQLVQLSNILTTSSKYSKVQNYAYSYMKKRPNTFAVSRLSDVNIKTDAEYYFSYTGITFIFQEYSVAAYAVGHPTVSVPNSVYK
jgi:uncharacterized protein YraI